MVVARLPVLALLLALLPAVSGCDDTSPTQHLDQARRLLDAGEVPAAVIELRNALRKNPNLGPAHALLGRAYARQGDHAAALRAYRRARERGVDDAATRLGMLRAQVRTGQHLAVIEALAGRSGLSAAQELVLADAELAAGLPEQAGRRYRQHPDSSAARLGLARIAALAGDLPEAAALAEQALALDPGNGEARLALGRIELGRGRLDEAAAAFRAALDHPGLLVAGNLGLARVSLAADDAAQAAGYARRAVALAPQHAPAHYLAALAAFEQGDWDAARSSLDQALARAADDPAILYLSAALHARQGDAQAAVRVLERSLAANPDHEATRLLLASLYLGAADPGSAAAVLETLAADGANLRALTLYGTAMLRLDDVEAATAAFERALALAPGTAALRNRLALSLAAGGDLAAAESQLQAASVKDGPDPGSDYLLAMIRLGRGDWEGALEAARDLGRREPGNPLAEHLAGSAYLAGGRIHAARTAFETALSLDPGFFPAVHGLARVAALEPDGSSVQAVYLSFLEARPGHPEALMALAELALADGDMQTAQAHLERAAAAPADAPAALTANLALARLHLDAGRLEPASAHAAVVLERQPAHTGALLLEARIALAGSRPETAGPALNALQTHLDRGARDPGLRLAVAELQARLGRLGAARANLEQVLADSAGTSIAALQGLARLDLRDRSLRDARARLEALAQLGDDSPQFQLLQADLDAAAGRTREARAAYGRLARAGQRTALLRLVTIAPDDAMALEQLDDWLQAHPDDAEARRLLADALAGTEPERALRHYEALMPSEDPALLNNLAWLYQARRDPRAETMARRALAAAPGNPSVLDTLGWILQQQGRSGEALPLFRSSLRVAPGNPSVLYHLGVALRDSGDLEGARAALDQALSQGQRSDAAGRPFPEAEAARRALTGLEAQAEAGPDPAAS